jgi:lipopolysaccharide export LptBFGC system permease protein LptF
MNRFSPLIARYLVQAVMPYFIFSWLLLSVILFVQQASRFSDILFSVNIPSGLVWQLTIALIPSVVAFTCPMAALVGVIIGLSKMQGDSELVVIRAAGVGNFQITLPIIALGIILSAFAFFINLKGVPFAAQLVKQVAIQSAIYKLESPIEPGVFNTEINGYTIYVKSGDMQKGEWRNIFIFNEDTKTKQVRLITSTNGRIDSSDEASELVLQNAVVSTFSTDPAQPKYVSESVGGLRFAIKTKRGELIDRLTNRTQTPEELGLAELSEFSRTVEGKDRVEAQILLFRMLMLSITPLIFVLLGAALVLRFNRGGRGFGIFLALASLVIYYLLALLGEQLARTDKISVFVGSLLPVAASALAIVFLYLSPRLITNDVFGSIKLAVMGRLSRREAAQRSRRSLYLDLSTGILDFDIVRALVKFFLLTISFLAAIFIIFTAFELWKFAGTIDGGVWLLTRYLFFLLPFIYIQLAPSALMIAMLATYVIKSRQNEVVTWMSAGQSVYRLLAPCFLLMLAIGGANYALQETVLPRANQVQDDLRMQIRSRGKSAPGAGKLWVANDRRIYSFTLPEGTRSGGRNVNDLSVYEFAPDGGRLQAVYKAPQAVWEHDRIRFVGTAEKSTISGTGKPAIEKIENGELAEDSNPLAEFNQKPAHLTAAGVKEAIRHSDSDAEKRAFRIALQKKYATLFLPLVIMLFTAPFALSISRKAKVVTVGYAVGLWLLFMGVTNVFEQFGQNGYLRAELAVWGPVALFSLVGVYLLSRVRT